MRLVLKLADRQLYAAIRARRASGPQAGGTDVLSLLLAAHDENGQPLSDHEIRDELMTLVLAGHETTANQLAWAWERLVRTPAALQALNTAVRGESAGAEDAIEATILEAMRCRPVIPITGRRVAVPWRLGEYGVPGDTAIAISILLLHHREDLYPDPFAFRPERWYTETGVAKPGTYEWLPFGGGTRRCLGATLAMAEQRVVLREMVTRLEVEPTWRKPERPVHRNVTMIPARGGRVVISARR
jgi:cytochrome P450